ncbi:hypothetical protein TK1949 [Thermococcus kodakarensis KOD1]|uniref:Uncharacterized protein n=1 Tax=Thermococcus kodakarensis (strain ATCC BAA-918 / JCM 12380 / KOD1) TaxID=69014 RepID=Q5JDL0_THEKO|nr:hypothetical protein [Thermococcus kodakarensis]WCN27835.1 hypothetical protein POG15_09920 [Thermococcus kodakarensis]WCN30133.1 hypothetical protein POG21_09905 [Thermococcus kodakarensis]BAD86138.1 hypothetical protein TK1949 [Thermococcus kodakarensis KOD1]
MNISKKISAVCIVVLVLSAFWWHKANTLKTEYSGSERSYIAMWISQEAAFIRAFSEDALNFINSSNYTGAVVSIKHTEGVMMSFREPLYMITLHKDGFNTSMLKMTQTDSCVNFLELSAEIIPRGDDDDIKVVKEGLTEIWNFSDQLLKRYPLSARASEETLRRNWELQNKCRILLEKLENKG